MIESKLYISTLQEEMVSLGAESECSSSWLDSVLIGGKDPDHRRIPVCKVCIEFPNIPLIADMYKIADFGLAREVPAVREQTGGYFNSMNWAGTQTVHPPVNLFPSEARAFSNHGIRNNMINICILLDRGFLETQWTWYVVSKVIISLTIYRNTDLFSGK